MVPLRLGHIRKIAQVIYYALWRQERIILDPLRYMVIHHIDNP